MLFMGLDVGTQGARSVILDERGVCYAMARSEFDKNAEVQGLPEGFSEQYPSVWLDALNDVIVKSLNDLDAVRKKRSALRAISIASTSGTIIPVDADGGAVRPAIMYRDLRARKESKEINTAGSEHCNRHGYRTNATFGLPKILWMIRNEPEIVERARHLEHATDFLVGYLTGTHGISDFSDALKSCYDLIDLRWPDFLADKLSVPMEKLPVVATPGDAVGTISPELASRWGLEPSVKIMAGCTDGTAGFLASGAREVGESCTTIGTTLVIRSVNSEIVRDPLGRLYSHRHPDGTWLPGGASSVGAACFRHYIPDGDHEELSAEAEQIIPSVFLAYPLVGTGERMPVADTQAEAFFTPRPSNPVEMYAACLQGVSFVERWCYELMSGLGCYTDGAVHTVGGGARNRLWCQMRSDILKRPVQLPRLSAPAVGAAILAATGCGLDSAAVDMVALRDEFEPNRRNAARYDHFYGKFREECSSRGIGTRQPSGRFY